MALALQGGGAHGAFTWGVLDALLEQRADPIVAVSGASAGAMNALLLAHGLLEGGRDGARATLARFWTALGASVPWDAWGLVNSDGTQLSAPAQWLLRWMTSVSPTQANPMRMNPLRELLARCVDFEHLRAQSRIALHIAIIGREMPVPSRNAQTQPSRKPPAARIRISRSVSPMVAFDSASSRF